MHILQRLLFQGSKEIIIDENGRVKIKHFLFGSEKSNSFTLRELDSEFEQYSNKAYKPLFYFTILLIVTLRLVYEGVFSESGNEIWLAVIFVPFLLSSGYYYLKGKAKLIVIKKRFTGELAFTVWKNTPSESECERFINTLKSKIDDVHNPKPKKFNDKLNEYKSCLEFLIHDDVISQDEGNMIYTRYKEKHQKAQVYPIKTNGE